MQKCGQMPLHYAPIFRESTGRSANALRKIFVIYSIASELRDTRDCYSTGHWYIGVCTGRSANDILTSKLYPTWRH